MAKSRAEPRTRRCHGCGYRFVVSGEELFCSTLCAGSVSTGTILVALQRLARSQARQAQ